MVDGRQRNNIKIGLFVEIVQKPYQRTGKLTEGVIAKILTSSESHSHGIKVPLNQQSVSPFSFDGESELIMSIVLAVVGFGLILLMEKLAVNLFVEFHLKFLFYFFSQGSCNYSTSRVQKSWF